MAESSTLAVINAQGDRQTTGELTGQMLLDGRQCLYGDEIRANDLVAANFDCRDVHTGGGLYLLRSQDGWHGCRRMMRVPDGITIDQDGLGDWVTVPSMEATRWQVVGIVETVYRPTR